ncbi:MAG: leucine-rich repeat protein, partial [Bacteroidaceae bacterium]|nr:leucine-rich repeat protein [Bacteroidaceae bacterium]
DHILTLPAAQTSNKQNIFASGDVVVPLKKYPAAMSHNADWNFVGNPYPCYYDLRAIKEHVIVYLWDDSQETFRCFDTRNDNGFVLAPCQGFFVQATDIEHLTFQASGRRILGKFHLPEPDDDEDDNDEEAAARSLAPEEKAMSAADTFNPENPGDPGANYYNPMTGEAYFDLFQPGRMNLAEELLLDNSRVQPEDVKILTVVAPMAGTDLFFSNYSNATRVDLGKSSGFTDIPAWSFTYMTKLKELILPSCVQSIAGDAFLYTSSIERLDIYATTPPTVDSKTFKSFNKENCLVRVPNEAVAAYKAATYWKDFTIMPLEGGGEELQSVTLMVKTPDGQDLTGQCSILWHDADNNLLGVGSTLSAQPVGSTVFYSVGLPANAANLYVPVPEGTFTILSADNVITITLEATGVVDLGGKQLSGSSGVLDVAFVASDSEAPTVFNSADLVLTIYNKVSGQQLTDFVLRYPNVLFEQTQLEPGQTLQLNVTSRSDLFQSTQAETTVDETGVFKAELIVKEWGLANITCSPAEGVTDIKALVFDQNGKYVARYAANSTVVRVKELKDGAYKVVLVQQNQFLNAVGSLDDLRRTVLREGEDYALLSIRLAAGTTSQYEAAVPALDMSRISHVSTASYIATNDPHVHIATAATLKAKVVFKEE